MISYGTNKPLIMLVIIIVEIGILFNQWFIYLNRPGEKKILYHLVLILLLIFYNLAEVFFQVKRIAVIPDIYQFFVGFGFGYVFASYCPVFFYGNMQIEELRFHRKFGFLLILAPITVFHFLIYPINHIFSFIRKLIYLISGIYAITIFINILCAKFKHHRRDQDKGALPERLIFIFSVIPVAITPIFSGWMGLDKWIITITFNICFLVVNAIYMRQIIWLSRSEQDKLLELSDFASTNNMIAQTIQQDTHHKKYKVWNLTKREIEIIELVAQGLEYKRIGEQLYISDKTVKKHVQNIFLKAGVSTRSFLIHALNN